MSILILKAIYLPVRDYECFNDFESATFPEIKDILFEFDGRQADAPPTRRLGGKAESEMGIQGDA